MSHFSDGLYRWYRQHQRDLPWRSTCDPYLIWISETILQQTRISQGLPYYYRFTGRFPDIGSLASAPEDDLMKIWEGLGYYSRARNMHTAAKTIVNEMNGQFPRDYLTLLKLKGVGVYTASAVASIAYNQAYAVADGNVLRLLTRYFGIFEPVDTLSGKRIVQRKAMELLDKNNPGFHNQALMEFGALCCSPKNPGCSNCPLKSTCFAYAGNMVKLLPVKSKRINRRVRFFQFYLFENDSHIVIEKRRENDIWKNLYQFPLYESSHELSDNEIINNPFLQTLAENYRPVPAEISRVYRHELTHQRIMARFIRIHHSKLSGLYKLMTVNKKEIHKFAFPALIRNYLVEEKMIR